MSPLKSPCLLLVSAAHFGIDAYSSFLSPLLPLLITPFILKPRSAWSGRSVSRSPAERGRSRGVLLWNVWDNVEWARGLIRDPKPMSHEAREALVRA